MNFESMNANDNECIYVGCTDIALFGYIGYDIPLYCHTHATNKTTKIINNIEIFKYNEKDCKKYGSGKIKRSLNSICNIIGCQKQCCFNYPSELCAIRCKEHKNKGMVNIKYKHCSIVDCFREARYNYEFEKDGMYCRDHKIFGMINFKKNIIYTKKMLKSINICNIIGCEKMCCFNYPSESHGVRCKEHKNKGMVNIKYKHCSIVDCFREARYNYEFEKDGIYCRDHKIIGMINIK